MATNVIMPQLGESVVEGTISRWLVQVGDTVEQYRPIMEVSTDKVDTEVPAPVAGVVLKLYHPEGATVHAGTVIAAIGQAGEAVADAPARVDLH
ncbi:MAG: biotin/lipoyl-containing protein, partial [Anaerolineae bacterium]